MNILMLVNEVPYPVTSGGKARSLNLIRHLSRNHSIVLCCFARTEEEEQNAHILEAYCRELYVFRVAGSTSDATAVRTVLSSPKPWLVGAYSNPEMRNTIERLFEENRFDLVQVERYFLVHNVADIAQKWNTPIVLDEQNIEFAVSQQRCELTRHPFWRLVRHIEYRKEKYWEIGMWRIVSACVTCSNEDREVVQQIVPEAHVTVVPNAVDCNHFHKDLRPQAENSRGDLSIIFVGNYVYHPNVDAVLYFSKLIYPPILRSEPSVRFHVVGNDPPDSVRQLSHDSTITVTGRVKDVRPYLAQATVFVCPLRLGGGTKMKMLEAMAMGKPIVSTTIGCKGLNVASGETLIIADEPSRFADAVIKLLRDNQLRHELGSNARKWAEMNCSWDASILALEKVYRGILEKNKTPW